MTWLLPGKCTEPGLRLLMVSIRSGNLSQSLQHVAGDTDKKHTICLRVLPVDDDLKVLWAHKSQDVETIVFDTGLMFNMRAMVYGDHQWGVFPARSSLSGWTILKESYKWRRGPLNSMVKPAKRRPPRGFRRDCIMINLLDVPTSVNVTLDNDPGVNESSEYTALACGPSHTPISVNSCVVNGVRFVVHSRDERRTTQNSGICSPGPNGEMYYGQLEQSECFHILSFKTVLFELLRDSDDEDLVNLDIDDGVNVVYSSEEED
ncbi:hypothetical protein Tco_0137872 [Tanacetum coccineum]